MYSVRGFIGCTEKRKQKTGESKDNVGDRSP